MEQSNCKTNTYASKLEDENSRLKEDVNELKVTIKNTVNDHANSLLELETQLSQLKKEKNEIRNGFTNSQEESAKLHATGLRPVPCRQEK